jgi:hypothetical protein
MSAVCQRCAQFTSSKAKYLFLALRDGWRLRTAVPVSCVLLLERS